MLPPLWVWKIYVKSERGAGVWGSKVELFLSKGSQSIVRRESVLWLGAWEPELASSVTLSG